MAGLLLLPQLFSERTLLSRALEVSMKMWQSIRKHCSCSSSAANKGVAVDFTLAHVAQSGTDVL
jgi:hypothetical protein